MEHRVVTPRERYVYQHQVLASFLFRFVSRHPVTIIECVLPCDDEGFLLFTSLTVIDQRLQSPDRGAWLGIVC